MGPLQRTQGKPQPDIFATTGDYLRLWKIVEDGKTVEMECVLNDVGAAPQAAWELTSGRTSTRSSARH